MAHPRRDVVRCCAALVALALAGCGSSEQAVDARRR